MRKTLLSAAFGFLLASALVSTQFATRDSVADWDGQVFRNSSFKGAYVFQLTGTVFLPGADPFNGPFARVGRMVADGRGNFTVSLAVANYNGFVFRESYAGTYNVNPDGTYWAKLNPGFPNADFTFDGVFQDGGRKGTMILSAIDGVPIPQLPPGIPITPSAWVGTTISGTVERQ